jgi:hypothetical protein
MCQPLPFITLAISFLLTCLTGINTAKNVVTIERTIIVQNSIVGNYKENNHKGDLYLPRVYRVAL